MSLQEFRGPRRGNLMDADLPIVLADTITAESDRQDTPWITS
ncbi:MAG: hypothetical protein WKF75_03995 [Singulisphaera sp.]